MSFRSISRLYQIQEQALAFDPKFVILNDQGHCDFIVKSTLLALGDKLSLFDAYGNELFKIRQQLIAFFLTFNVYAVDDTEVASVQRRGMPWNYKLEVTSPVFGDYRMNWHSGILNQEFVLMKQDKVVARINHKRTVFTHTYSVEIADDITDGEVPFVLSLVIVLWCAQRYRGHAGKINK